MSINLPDNVTFKFSNSCNCCTRSNLEDSSKVYINSKGKVEPYDYRKATNINDVFARSMFHLEESLYKKVTSFGGNINEFRDRISSLYEGIFYLRIFLVVHIESLNDQIKYYYKEIKEKQP